MDKGVSGVVSVEIVGVLLAGYIYFKNVFVSR